ncbi:hypothetical protein [Streptosporangium sp. NPDC049376]|uniref:hypothetical protein n=1 Tax=Streptosporangium sp. NPDC049376 TaxID=3366192 RepID=UPI0037A7376D
MTGCSHLEGLLVTGPARGRMWANSIMSDEGFQPLFDDGAPLGFARWYLRWLEEAEAQVLPSAR